MFVLFTIFILFSGCASNSKKAPITEAGYPSGQSVRRHVVSPGETLYSIALRYEMDYKKISEINHLDGSYRIHPGQVLILNAGPKSTLGQPQKVAAGTPQKSRSTNSSGSKNQTKISGYSGSENASLSSIKWQWPIKGKVLEVFGPNGGLNKGIDIHAKLGDSVVAAADGEVVYSGSGLRGYGKLLIVKHNQNYLSAYAHNRVLNVSEGDAVKAGQKIAEVGISGTNTSKLHFEIRLDGKPVDPMILLPKL